MTEFSRPRALAGASIVALAVVAWGSILLVPDARYWDDWVSTHDPVGIYTDLGLPWLIAPSVALVAIGPVAFKIVSLVATAFTGWAVWRIADQGLGLSAFERWLAAALVVVLPFNSGRVALSVLATYTVSLALFVGGWQLLLSADRVRHRWVLPVAGTVLIFLSFTTASLLVFVVVPVAHLWWVRRDPARGFWANTGRFAARFWYLLAAPIVFWVVRTILFQPSGVYADYNTFVLPSAEDPAAAGLALAGLILVAVALVLTLSYRDRGTAVALPLLAGLTGMCGVAFFASGPSGTIPRSAIAVSLAGGAIVLLIASGLALIRRRPIAAADVALLAAGLAALALGAAPYLLVGKIPSFTVWETRHQLLLPLGSALVLVVVLRQAAGLVTLRVARVGGALAVVGFLFVSAYLTMTLIADSRKQQLITAALAADPAVRGASVVVFLDDAAPLNYDGRSYSAYEFNGWMRTAFGDETRYGLNLSAVPEFLALGGDHFVPFGPRYGYADWMPSDEGVLVEIHNAGASRRSLAFGGEGIAITTTVVSDLRMLPQD